MNTLTYRLLLLSLLAFAIAYTIAARNIPMDLWTAAETINTQTLPTAYGITLIVVLTLLLVQTQPGTAHPGSLQWRHLTGLCVGIGGFTLALPWVNLWIALAVLLALSSLWLGERRWQAIAAISLLPPLVGYVGIELLLGVYVP